MIQYLTREELSVKKYDNCVYEAPNSRIYALSWYLDCVSRNWGALVLDNYQAVMPICWNRKFCIHYVHTPPWCQQLGVFSNKPIDENLMLQFIGAIPDKFLKIDLQFNQANVFTHPALQPRKNYVLDLNRCYSDMYHGFNKNRKRILNKIKAHALNLKVQPISAIEFLNLYNNVPTKYFASNYMFRSLINLLNSKKGYCIGGYKDGELLGGLYYFRSKNRIYYLTPVATHDGYGLNVNTLLVDYLIEHHQQKKIILDFEGSMIENIARFYKSFGATPEYYASLSLRRRLAGSFF